MWNLRVLLVSILAKRPIAWVAIEQPWPSSWLCEAADCFLSLCGLAEEVGLGPLDCFPNSLLTPKRKPDQGIEFSGACLCPYNRAPFCMTVNEYSSFARLAHLLWGVPLARSQKFLLMLFLPT